MAAWETILYTIINSILIMLGSFANLLVISSFILFSSIREGTSFFLINLSVADFLVCALYQPLLVYRFHHPDQSNLFELPQRFLGYGLLTASLNGLLSVTFDRFVAIYFPYKYVIWITEKNTARIILASCVISFAMGLICLSKAALRLAYVYNTAIIITVPILYCVIYREARKQAGRMLEFQRGPQSIISKATTGVGAVLVTTLLCWLPLILLPTFTAKLDTDEEILKALLWCITAGCVNSCINPFIYYYKFQYFRRNITKLFQGIWRNVGGRRLLRISRKNRASVYPS